MPKSKHRPKHRRKKKAERRRKQKKNEIRKAMQAHQAKLTGIAYLHAAQKIPR